jgi:putative acetyltransferase
MDFQDCIQFANENPLSYFATIEAGQPRVRPLGLWFADDAGRVVGHILLTPTAVESGEKVIQGMALDPMAVLPERQREGIGTRLVKNGLSVLHNRSSPFAIVLGHPDYYPRFGFEPASRYGIRCQWERVPDEAFMIFIFDEIVMESIAGVARHRDEFDEAI